MTYEIDFSRSLDGQHRQLVVEQLNKSLAELERPAIELHRSVHQLRKRSKKIRALLRLYRPLDEAWFQLENNRFRKLAAANGELRDAKVAVDTFDALMRYFSAQLDDSGFVEVRAALIGRRNRHASNTSQLPSLQKALRDAITAVNGWPETAVSSSCLITGFGKTYRRGHRAMRRCAHDRNPDSWHEWRKWAKYQGYQWSLFRDQCPAQVSRLTKRFRQFTELLGDQHDLSNLARMLQTDFTEVGAGRSREVLYALIHQRAHILRRAAWPLGMKLFADKPGTAKRKLQHSLELKSPR